MKPSSQAVEEWAKSVASKNMRPLTEKEATEFMKYFMSQKDLDKDKELIEILDQKKGGYSSVLWLRIKYHHTFSITPSLCVYLGENIIKNFGMSTMIANYLQYIAKEIGIKKIGFDEWCMFAFPMGHPTDKSWEELWDAQKLDSEARQEDRYRYCDNVLDYPEFMESLKF